jgi:hypothetical protein
VKVLATIHIQPARKPEKGEKSLIDKIVDEVKGAVQ